MAVRVSSFVLMGLLLAGLVGCHRAPARPREKPAPVKDDPAAQRMIQTFEEATRRTQPVEAPQPPDLTMTGKSVGKLYADVVRLWKEIPYKTPDGKRIEYSATLETEMGNIEIALLADAAPNHVRNFVALARAGYFEGLSFDRLLHVVVESRSGQGADSRRDRGGDPLGADGYG